MKAKNYLESESEEMKWKNQKYEEMIDGLKKKCTDLNDKILKLNQENLCEQQKIKNMHELNQELEHSIERYKI